MYLKHFTHNILTCSTPMAAQPSPPPLHCESLNDLRNPSACPSSRYPLYVFLHIFHTSLASLSANPFSFNFYSSKSQKGTRGRPSQAGEFFSRLGRAARRRRVSARLGAPGGVEFFSRLSRAFCAGGGGGPAAAAGRQGRRRRLGQAKTIDHS